MSFNCSFLFYAIILLMSCNLSPSIDPSPGLRRAMDNFISENHEGNCYSMVFSTIGNNCIVQLSEKPNEKGAYNIYKSKIGYVKFSIEYCNGEESIYRYYIGNHCHLMQYKYDESMYSGYDFPVVAFCLKDSNCVIPINSNYNETPIIKDYNVISNRSLNQTLNKYMNDNVSFLYILDFSRYDKENVITLSLSLKFNKEKTKYYFFRQGRLVCIYNLTPKAKKEFFGDGLYKFEHCINGYQSCSKDHLELNKDYKVINGILEEQIVEYHYFEAPPLKSESH